MTFNFDSTPHGGALPGEWSNSDRAFIQQLRAHYPELSLPDWGDLALGSAWGSYSQDIYAVGWVDWLESRDDGFLAYLYVSQCKPAFEWGGTGLFMSEVWAYAAARPWEANAALPAWAGA
ncbi:hypothetical protein G3A43_06590 [Paraburkholderia aspalathi]|nr:hypothetical protein [Paraburkholderia aspalathi]MBK3779917.1 hypothetical protein [Paraburkholderia aspalathi]